MNTAAAPVTEGSRTSDGTHRPSAPVAGDLQRPGPHLRSDRASSLLGLVASTVAGVHERQTGPAPCTPRPRGHRRPAPGRGGPLRAALGGQLAEHHRLARAGRRRCRRPPTRTATTSPTTEDGADGFEKLFSIDRSRWTQTARASLATIEENWSEMSDYNDQIFALWAPGAARPGRCGLHRREVGRLLRPRPGHDRPRRSPSTRGPRRRLSRPPADARVDHRR